MRVAACESAKTDVSLMERYKEGDMSMLSEVSAVEGNAQRNSP